MKDYFELGSSPSGEDCVQVESGKDYRPAMIEELKKYKEQLEKIFPIPDSLTCYFGIKWFPHDFGSYGEVVIYYHDDIDEEVDFALFIEGSLPDNWNDLEIREWIFTPRIPKCNQCDSAVINGTYCHEGGCPNIDKEYDFEEKRWIKKIDNFDFDMSEEIQDMADDWNEE